MEALKLNCPSSTAVVCSLPFPCPKSPPRYPDMMGKRKELLKVQMLEREIGFLEEELKSCEGLQLASRSCKEVDDFVIANADPLIPTNQKIRKSCRFWKWLCCGKSCFSLSWICCCFSGCSLHLGTPNCCKCCRSEKKCCSHKTSSCCFRSCPPCCCFGNISCWKCCKCRAPSCPKCSPKCTWSWSCSCSCLKCTKVCPCFNCRKNCCSPSCCPLF